jgi:adenylate cyclase class 2
MQKEIEVKAKVNNLEELKSKLIELGCIFNEPEVQEDTTFVNFDGDYTVFMPETNFIRIRKTKDSIIFTLKRPQSNELDCIEREVKVSDSKQLQDMLKFMGYHSVVNLTKTRTKTKYNDMEICLDEVKELGSFIEVEKVVEGNGNLVQEELFSFLETLGINREDRVLNGYDTLVYLKQNNAKL